MLYFYETRSYYKKKLIFLFFLYSPILINRSLLFYICWIFFFYALCLFMISGIFPMPKFLVETSSSSILVFYALAKCFSRW